MIRKHRNIYDTNRTVKRRSRLSKGWCRGCDLAMVEDGQKCPVCGKKILPKRDKKG